MVPVELQSVDEAIGRPANPNELHNSEEPLVAAALLPLLQLRHEEEAETGPHHHPVHRARQAYARSQEHNILPLVEWCCPVFQYLAKSQ